MFCTQRTMCENGSLSWSILVVFDHVSQRRQSHEFQMRLVPVVTRNLSMSNLINVEGEEQEAARTDHHSEMDCSTSASVFTKLLPIKM
jgi:hypothetical protein